MYKKLCIWQVSNWELNECYMVLMFMVYIFHSLSCVWFMLFVYFQTINNDTTKYNCIAMQISKELQNLCLVHAIKCSYFGPWAVSWAFLWGFWSVCRRQCFWSPRRHFGAWHSCSGRKNMGECVAVGASEEGNREVIEDTRRPVVGIL